MAKQVILTGIRANSELHLGNYLGGIQPMVRLQKKYGDNYQINMFVPDLHSFTTPIEHSKLYLQIIKNLSMYVASGLDISNENTFIYRQSFVSAHSELAVILNNFTYMGELKRMTQYKEKAGKNDDLRSTVGLFDYPVLMAADILLYGAHWVVVGEDQRQHLELARDISQRLNNKFAQTLFIVPETWDKQLQFANLDIAVRIRSLRNPLKKMSKSVSDPAGTILLTDSPDEAAKKIISSTTDSIGRINFNMQQQPGIGNLIQILALLLDRPIYEIAEKWKGKINYSELKNAVAKEVSVFLTNYQKRLANTNEAELMRKLESSEFLMRDVAGQYLYRMQQAVGLRP